MYIEQLEACCACGVLFDLPTNYMLSQRTHKQAINSVKAYIIDIIVNEAIEYGDADTNQGFSLYIATTNTKNQSLTEQALLDLGFKSFKFDSIMAHSPRPNNALKFWKRHGMPRKAYDRVRAFFKDHKDDEE